MINPIGAVLIKTKAAGFLLSLFVNFEKFYGRCDVLYFDLILKHDGNRQMLLKRIISDSVEDF